ncbi:MULTISPECIES: hypothetical protein [unclassified Nocardia]|uniref:hypothetical protein n=1 Tax=unclassified Nocardia TaxID=2637762 RepID=UPI001CE40DF8|nr:MULTISPECIES: hypothetical protein [unclassified Nocardia]
MRYLPAAAVTGGLAAVAIAFATPTAGATANRIAVLPGVNFGLGTNYGTGCTYMIEAIVDDAAVPVAFYDNGVPIGTIRPSGGVALLQWVPGSVGTHTIAAFQAPDAKQGIAIDIRVATGVHLGYGCNVFG